jgi:hypothetical protein
MSRSRLARCYTPCRRCSAACRSGMKTNWPAPTRRQRCGLDTRPEWRPPGTYKASLKPPMPTFPGIIAGLLNLNTVTLFELARARGAMTEEMYYQVAGAFCASCLQGCRNNA